MNKRIIIFLVSVLLATPTICFAKKGSNNGGKGPHPSQSAYEHANKNARFKRDEIWNADKETKKEAAKIKRKEEKAQKKAERKAKKDKKETEGTNKQTEK